MKRILPFTFVLLFYCSSLTAQFASNAYYLVDSLPYDELEKYDKEIIDSVLAVYHKTTNDTVQANLLLYLTENLENNEAWLPYNKLLLEHARFKLQSSVTSPKLIRFYKNILAGTYNNYGYDYNLLGKKDKALGYFLESKKILEELQNKVGLSDVYNNIGLIYKNLGQTSRALDYYFKCLKIAEDLNDNRGIASATNNMGMLFMDLEEYDKSEAYLKRALQQWQKLNNKRGISSTLNNLGLLFDKKKKYDLSVEFYNQALKWNEKTGDKEGIGTSFGNLGWVCVKRKQYTKAEDYFERGLVYRKLINDKAGICAAYFNLGSVKRLQLQAKAAKTYAEQSYSMALDLGYPDLIRKTAHLMYLLEKESGNSKDALPYYEEYIQMRDSISSEQSRNLSVKKQFQYEFDMKEAELKAEQDKRELVLGAQIKRQQLVFMVSLIGGIIFLIFSILLYKRIKVINSQKQIIENQKSEITGAFSALHEKNKEVMDSIHYARRIQQALLTSDDFFKQQLGNDYFVLYRPKDIVSGDFYWSTKMNIPNNSESRKAKEVMYIALCDSTGHGVPGAFMSLLNIGFISEAINEKGIYNPAEVYDYVRDKLISNINKEGQKDGFDGSLICLDKKNMELHYASSNTRPVLVRNGELISLKNDRMPVGLGEITEKFNLYTQQLKKGDTLYLFTDGYADQFGSERNKKLTSKKFRDMLLQFSNYSMDEQKENLHGFFNIWKGNNEQVDDVLVMGIKI